jgi:hypothetical protein
VNWWGGRGFEEWMWNVAFDGIGSTAIATVVAVYFVLRTLRQDQQLAAQSLLDQQRMDRVAAFEAACQRMVDSTKTQLSAASSTPARTAWRNDLFHLALAVPADETLLAELLRTASDAAREFQGEKAARGNVVASVWSALAKRLAVPTYFDGVDPEVAADAVATVRRGERYNFD